MASSLNKQNLNEFCQNELDKLESKELLRSIKKLQQLYPNAVNYCSNDYLGLANELLKQQSDQDYWGATGSRLLTGNFDVHEELEKEIADWKSTEAALIYPSGYQANIGALSVLANPRDVFFSDEYNHACILDGIKLSSAKKFIYKHRDIQHLEELLIKQRDKYQKAWIVTDSIFSMHGSAAPLENICALAEKYNCFIYIDEAHASGVLGAKGAGLAAELKLSEKIQVQMGTFSKAIGTQGAYIAGSKSLIDYLVNKSRSFIYSTGLSPQLCRQTLKNIRKIRSEDSPVQKLNEKIIFFKEKLQELQISNHINSNCAIFSFEIVEQYKCKEISKLLCDVGNLVLPILAPTVPKPLIRVCINLNHSNSDLEKLAKALKQFEISAASGTKTV